MTHEETYRAQVEAMPRIRFVCERDLIVGPDTHAIGFLWKRKFDAEPGEFVYQRRIIVRLRFRLWLDLRVR